MLLGSTLGFVQSLGAKMVPPPAPAGAAATAAASRPTDTDAIRSRFTLPPAGHAARAPRFWSGAVIIRLDAR
jgi:hypothetical protein